MPIAAVAIIAGAAIVAGAKAASAGSTINEQRAQAIQSDAERRAIAESEKGFQAQEAELRPFVEVGQQSITTLGDEIDQLTRPFTPEDFQADPGFQFRIQQGERGINNFLSSRGLTTSGRAGKELVRFNQGEASQEFDRAFNRFTLTQGNRFNRLLALSRSGQEATNQLAGARRDATTSNVRAILGSGQNRSEQQSRIGEIENQARRRRGDAIAGFGKTISELGGSFAGGGGAAGGVT